MFNNHNEESLDHLLGQVIRAHHSRTHALLQKLNVYPGQPHILLMLRKQNGRTQKEFSNQIGIQAATVTVMLKRMEKAGLIERRPDPADLRASRVFLTAKGAVLAEKVKAIIHGFNEKCFDGFSDTEKEQLRRFLTIIRDNLKAL